jgi:hypothetical protein
MMPAQATRGRLAAASIAAARRPKNRVAEGLFTAITKAAPQRATIRGTLTNASATHRWQPHRSALAQWELPMQRHSLRAA